MTEIIASETFGHGRPGDLNAETWTLNLHKGREYSIDRFTGAGEIAKSGRSNNDDCSYSSESSTEFLSMEQALLYCEGSSFMKLYKFFPVHTWKRLIDACEMSEKERKQQLNFYKEALEIHARDYIPYEKD